MAHDTTIGTLTADDVIALKAATSFYISINPYNGTTQIHCTAKLGAVKRGPFERQAGDVTHAIALYPQTTKRARFNIMFRNGAMDAIARIVRAGDQLRINAFNNNNQYCDRAELFHDVCQLTIVRADAKGHPRAIVREMTIADSVTPENSARAIYAESVASEEYEIAIAKGAR